LGEADKYHDKNIQQNYRKGKEKKASEANA